MILTGKAKEDFSYKYNMSNFNEYSEVLQNALIIEFFDSVGIYIIIKKTVDIYWLYDIQYQNSNINISVFEPMQESRREAIKQAIIKANDIYNKTHEQS